MTRLQISATLMPFFLEQYKESGEYLLRKHREMHGAKLEKTLEEDRNKWAAENALAAASALIDADDNEDLE